MFVRLQNFVHGFRRVHDDHRTYSRGKLTLKVVSAKNSRYIYTQTIWGMYICLSSFTALWSTENFRFIFIYRVTLVRVPRRRLSVNFFPEKPLTMRAPPRDYYLNNGVSRIQSASFPLPPAAVYPLFFLLYFFASFRNVFVTRIRAVSPPPPRQSG